MLLVLAGLLGISQPASAAAGNFVNLSNRGLVGTGDDVRIVGFIIEDGARQVLVQALGPELANRGITNALADPVLTVIQTHEGEPPRTPLVPPVELMVNDNWEDSQVQLISDLWGGSPPLTAGSLSSAVVLTLEPGGYTARVEGKNGTVGVVLVEVFRIASPGEESPDREALTALYNALDGANWTNRTNWLSDEPLEKWYGVTVDDNGRVVGLELDENRLSGTIPPELGNFANLRFLDLDDNQLTGPIPPELGNLGNLEVLWLSGNELSGMLPVELGDLISLQDLDLDDNQLTGPIPPELGNLANLEVLWLSGNELSGTIPVELGDLASLQDLDLNFNELTGPIPPELGNLANLEALHLGGNELTGPIPAKLGELVNLRSLGLFANQLTGPIPPELGLLTNLELLWLSGNELIELANLERLFPSSNQLTGPIPPELGNLTNLQYLSLSSSELSGPIPPELGQLANLERLFLSGNQLSGPIPPELGSLSNLEYLYLNGNRLTGSISEDLLELGNLEIFHFEDNDGLCAPNTDAFTSWLMGIAEWSGPRCTLNLPPLIVSTIPGQTLVEGAGATTIRVGTAFSDPDSDALTFSSVSADEMVARIGMSGATLSVTPVAEGSTTVSVTAADAEGLEASLTFPVTVERLAPRSHNIILRVVHVTTDWMPYAGFGGWPAAAEPKESAALKYIEAAIWDETESVHLYEFDNNFDPRYYAGTDSAQIAYREKYVVGKHTGMPSDRIARQDFVKSAFVDFARYIAERFPDSDHHLLYSGHGGPGGRLFAGLLSREGAAEFLGTWREALGRRLGVIDMGGPCNKGGLSDLENFCAHARYYIASDLPNGGYTMDNWTIEKWNEVNVEDQYHSLFDTHGTLEEALVARIELKRKRYEYSRQDMIAKKVEQGNYLYSCTSTVAELGWNARLFIEQSGGSYDYGLDLWEYLTINDAPKPLLEMFDQTIIHDANNRDFFSWEEVANGIMMCCR